MSTLPLERELSARDLEPILAVAAKLAAPFDLTTMLNEVVAAARHVLRAERATVWLYDREADQLVLRLASDIEGQRIAAGTGLVGNCARTRRLINVPDCYSDPRFDPTMDRRSGYRTRCMLTLPLVGHDDTLVGVMQMLNKAEGVFDGADERLAEVLAAQCAVALQRVRMVEAALEGERLRQQLEMARVVQMSTLPSVMPRVPGYDLFGTFRPADLTGGDTYDLAEVGNGALIVLGDATGHGIGPALSVTQMQAMLRMAFRLGANLETAFIQVNNQLAEILPEDRFITAFIGLLDPQTHRIRFHSGGQGPILHFKAASGERTLYGPTSFPLAAMPIASLDAADAIDMRPGDILALVSDGIYEYRSAAGEEFGEARVARLLAANEDDGMEALSRRLFDAVRVFAAGAPQEDDMTVVLVKRHPGASRAFARKLEALEEVVAFTAEAFAEQGIEPELRWSVDLILEELFTNVVKYGRSGDALVRIDITGGPWGVEVAVVEDDADRFDPGGAPQTDTGKPLGEREAGGLGVHLVRKLADAIEYRYDAERRRGRVTFRKRHAGAGTRGE